MRVNRGREKVIHALVCCGFICLGCATRSTSSCVTRAPHHVMQTASITHVLRREVDGADTRLSRPPGRREPPVEIEADFDDRSCLTVSQE